MNRKITLAALIGAIDPVGLVGYRLGPGYEEYAELHSSAKPREHVFKNPEALVGLAPLDETGDGTSDCAELRKVLFRDQGIPPTWQWKPVRQIRYGEDIEPGTLIANFVNGKYPQSGHRHTALHLEQDADGFRIGVSGVPWIPAPGASLPQNGTKYYTVGW